jgi:GMP synthase-like glutamine amidotransferase
MGEPRMKLGILDCDELAAPLKKDFKCYAEMFRRLLDSVDGALELGVYSVLDNEYPAEINECDGYLLTGSKTGVYDSAPWLEALQEFVRRAYLSQVPLVGICFGHQMLAHALGGRAQKSELGWGIGALTQQRASMSSPPSWMDEAPEQLCLIYSHQDQVIELPEGAYRLYGSEFCPNGAFYIPGRVLAFQGHPEFTTEYIARLMHSRQERYQAGQYEHALDSLTRPLDNGLVARWIKQFVKDGQSRAGDAQ